MMFYGRNLGQEMVTLWVHAGDDLCGGSNPTALRRIYHDKNF